jgi:hypothetical protein
MIKLKGRKLEGLKSGVHVVSLFNTSTFVVRHKALTR